MAVWVFYVFHGIKIFKGLKLLLIIDYCPLITLIFTNYIIMMILNL